MGECITIKKPFDAHVHVRRGAMLRAVVPYTAAKFSRAIVMPNVDPPIETVEEAAAYKNEILTAVPQEYSFEPLMTLYLTKTLTRAEIEKGATGDTCKMYGVKSYPYGATTNSQWGYRSILEATHILEVLEKLGLPLLLHGEVHVNNRGEEVDPYESERLFIEDALPRLLDTYPRLKVSLEHLSTGSAADFMENHGQEGRLIATVTPHHLLYAREEVDSYPLLRCKPLIKSKADREKLRSLIAKGLPFIFAGTDSAPHPESKKLSPSPPFGVFSAPLAIELYAQVFEELGALDKLEAFLSIHGPRFYGLAPSTEMITLEKKDWQATEPVVTEEGEKIWPLGAVQHGLGNETIRWQFAH